MGQQIQILASGLDGPMTLITVPLPTKALSLRLLLQKSSNRSRLNTPAPPWPPGKRRRRRDIEVPIRTASVIGRNSMIHRRARVPIACIVLLACINVVPAEPLPTETFKILPAALAVEAGQAAIAACKAQGYTISVSVVDR